MARKKPRKKAQGEASGSKVMNESNEKIQEVVSGSTMKTGLITKPTNTNNEMDTEWMENSGLEGELNSGLESRIEGIILSPIQSTEELVQGSRMTRICRIGLKNKEINLI